MEKLTHKDLDILISSVDYWANQDFSASVLDQLLSIAMSPTGEDAQEKHKQEQQKREVAREQATQIRREQAILLKAKLLQLRDGIIASDFVEQSTRPL